MAGAYTAGGSSGTVGDVGALRFRLSGVAALGAARAAAATDMVVAAAAAARGDEGGVGDPCEVASHPRRHAAMIRVVMCLRAWYTCVMLMCARPWVTWSRALIAWANMAVMHSTAAARRAEPVVGGIVSGWAALT